jgi:hypothetical protein
MKVLTLTVSCDVPGCTAVASRNGVSRGAIIGALIGDGWRSGATRDVCPACRDKGHRP